MKLNKYFFENYPLETPYDMNNPRYVLSLDAVDSILEKVIKSKPYSLTIDDFSDVELVNALLHIGVIQKNDNMLGMAVPFFVEEDALILKELSKKVASNIAEEILAHKEEIIKITECIDNGYPAGRNLYHMLCAYIFDGLMFDYLEAKGLVTTSCVHDTGLDYLVIIYEDVSSLNEYSDLLLCSYNRFTVQGKGFVSFGDSNGNRKDFYRYMRQKELNQLSQYENIEINYSTEALIENFDKMVDGDYVNPDFMGIYEFFGYCQNGEIIVPTYDSHSYEVANELYEFVLGITKEKIATALSVIQNEKRLLSVAHKVPVKDIANEIYHLIFGEVNEILVASGLISNPPYHEGEGRYFKSFER